QAASSSSSKPSSDRAQRSGKPGGLEAAVKSLGAPPPPPQPDFGELAALMAMQQHLDPSGRGAGLLDQDKFMQDILHLSALAATNPAANPFSYLTPPPIPPPPPPIAASSTSGSSRPRSSSPHTDRSQSPGQQMPLDFGLFMNNLMQYQMLGAAGVG